MYVHQSEHMYIKDSHLLKPNDQPKPNQAPNQSEIPTEKSFQHNCKDIMNA